MHAVVLFALLGQTKYRLGQQPPAKTTTYNIAMHVRSSRLETECATDVKGSTCRMVQHLQVLIAGEKYELARTAQNVFRVGDYKARIVSEKTPRAEEYTRKYEILLSDGKTAKFAVVGEPE